MADLSPELKKLRSVVGPGAFLSLRRGTAYLKVWRGTTPWNVYVENRDGDTLWHSGERGPNPNISLFDKVSDTKEKIDVPGAARWMVRENGSPFGSTYSLKAEFLLTSAGRPQDKTRRDRRDRRTS